MKNLSVGILVLVLLSCSSSMAESWSVFLTGNTGKQKYSKSLDQTWFFKKSQKISRWNLGSGPPPLALHEALEIAEKAFRAGVSDSELWSLGDEVVLKQIYPGLAYYRIQFKGDWRKKEHMDVLVFMDGSISSALDSIELTVQEKPE